MAESADVLGRAAPAGHPARPRRRLLDGRHGRDRSARDLLAGAAARSAPRSVVSRSPTSIPPRPSKASAASTAASSARRATRMRVMAWAWERGEQRADAARPAPRPKHRVSRWACRSTRWSSGIRSCRSAASTRDDAPPRAPDSLEGPLQRPHALLRASRSSSSAARIPAAKSSSIPSARSMSSRPPTTSGSTDTSSAR